MKLLGAYRFMLFIWLCAGLFFAVPVLALEEKRKVPDTSQRLLGQASSSEGSVTRGTFERTVSLQVEHLAVLRQAVDQLILSIQVERFKQGQPLDREAVLEMSGFDSAQMGAWAQTVIELQDRQLAHYRVILRKLALMTPNASKGSVDSTKTIGDDKGSKGEPDRGRPQATRRARPLPSGGLTPAR